eukprot:4314934-Ditylum_brightwellii.AAC.1
MLQRVGVDDAPTTSWNPWANAVCERMHQTVANMLMTTTNGRANATQQAVQVVDDVLTTTVHARRCAVSQALGVSPGALIHRRD